MVSTILKTLFKEQWFSESNLTIWRLESQNIQTNSMRHLSVTKICTIIVRGFPLRCFHPKKAKINSQMKKSHIDLILEARKSFWAHIRRALQNRRSLAPTVTTQNTDNICLPQLDPWLLHVNVMAPFVRHMCAIDYVVANARFEVSNYEGSSCILSVNVTLVLGGCYSEGSICLYSLEGAWKLTNRRRFLWSWRPGGRIFNMNWENWKSVHSCLRVSCAC